MQLPKIDLSSLPDLDQLTGIFGSLSADGGGWSDDTLIVIMVWVYDTVMP
jgi:hypothetical protein